MEIIKRFGTVEQALEHAAEVEKKTYRESLLNNRDTILFSKSMATIDTNVPVELDVESMRVGEPNVEDLRALFTELEFTSLLKELLPVVEVTEVALQRGEIGRRCGERGQLHRRWRRAGGRGRAAGACGRAGGRRERRGAAGRANVVHGRGDDGRNPGRSAVRSPWRARCDFCGGGNGDRS